MLYKIWTIFNCILLLFLLTTNGLLIAASGGGLLRWAIHFNLILLTAFKVAPVLKEISEEEGDSK